MTTPKEKPQSEAVLQQIVNQINSIPNKDKFNIEFGEVKFEIKNGVLYRMYVVESLLFRKEEKG